MRHQFAGVADIAPTILDLAGVPLAKTINNVPQSPMEGISLQYALNAKDAPNRTKAQYYELYGNKGLWSDGWTIVTRDGSPSAHFEHTVLTTDSVPEILTILPTPF